MLDGVTLYFQRQYCEGFFCELSRIERRDSNTFTGSLGPLKVFHSPGGISVTGSLAKFLHGENITMLDPAAVGTAVNILGQETGLDMRHGQVCKIEAGKNLFTERPPADYLRLFGYPGRYMRTEYTKAGEVGTVHYYTPKGDYQFILYDKGMEAADRIPRQYRGLNILRAEYRVMHSKGIRRKLGQNLSAYDLGHEDVIEELERQFFEFYYGIPKMGKEFVMADGKITPNRFEKMLAEWFRQNRPKEYREILQSFRMAGNIDKQTMKRIRAKERQGDKGFKWQSTGPLIKELDALLEAGRMGQDKNYPLRLVKTA